MMNVTDNIDIEVGHRHGIEQIEDDVGPPNNIEQIEDHVGPSTNTGQNIISGSLDSDLKRKIAAASSNTNRDRVPSRVSSVSERKKKLYNCYLRRWRLKSFATNVTVRFLLIKPFRMKSNKCVLGCIWIP